MKATLPLVLLGFVFGILAGVILENRVLSQTNRAEKLPKNYASLHTKIAPSTEVSFESDQLTSSQPESANDDPARPKIAVENAIYNFGERESGEMVEHAFVVKNTGGSTLEIEKVVPACGCTVAKLSAKELAPGEEAEVAVKLTLALQKGPQNREIILQTNDPVRPRTKLALVGAAVPRVTVVPERVQINQNVESKAAAATLRIKNVRGLRFNVVETKTSGDAVDVKVDVVKPEEEFSVTVSLKPPFKHGDFRGWVHLITDHPGEYHTIGIPVIAYFTKSGESEPRPNPAGDNDAAAELINNAELGQQFQFSGPTIEGGQISDLEFKGKPVIVAFWASWCGVCKQEMPKLVAIYEKYHSRGLEVVGVSLDRKKTMLREYIADNGVPWRNIFFDPDLVSAVGNPLAKKYNVRGVPWFVLLDQSGKVVSRDARGPELDAAVVALLEKEPPATSSNIPRLDTVAQPGRVP